VRVHESRRLDPRDVTVFRGVPVTRERSGGDPSPSIHVAETRVTVMRFTEFEIGAAP
jgi:hypothetical protein